MKRKITFLSVLAATMLIGSLSGCGGDGKIHVTFWHTLGKTNQALLNNMITSFQAEHPEYVIDQSSQGGYDDLKSKLLQAIPAATNPVMAFCYPDHVAEYLEGSQAVVPMDSYFKDADLGFTEADGSHLEGTEVVYGEGDFINAYWEEGQQYSVEGTFSVPYAKSTEVLFYNKRAFDLLGYPVPTKWFNDDDPSDLTAMFNLCKKIYEDKLDDDSFVASLGYDSDSNLYITLSEQLGIPYTKQATLPKDRFPFATSTEAKALVRRLQELYGSKDDAKHLFITKGTNNGGYTSTLFAEQKVLMTIGSTGGASYNLGDFELGVAPIPQQDSEHLAAISQGPSICLLKNSSADQKKGAWLFYRYITTDINSVRYAIETGYEPVRISSYETPQYQEHLAVPEDEADDTIFKKVARQTAQMTNYYFTSPVFKGSATARTEVGGIITNVLLETKTIDKAFSDALTNCIYS